MLCSAKFRGRTKLARACQTRRCAHTQELLSIDSWDTGAIDARQRELSNWVFDIWHFPSEEAPAEPAEAPAGEAPVQEDAAALEQLPEAPA